MPALTGIGPGGRRKTVSYRQGGKGTPILVFEPRCGACLLNAPRWRRLVAAVDARRVRIIGVALEATGLSPAGLLAAFREAGVRGFPVLRPSGSSVFWYRLRLTPQTLLVGPGGHVRGVWSGILSAAGLARVMAVAARIGAGAPPGRSGPAASPIG